MRRVITFITVGLLVPAGLRYNLAPTTASR
jgi:hypothetical protein